MTAVKSDMVDRYPRDCPHTIRYPPMKMEWEDLTLLHWRYSASEVQALLPDTLKVETFDGSAWVGLVPFQMRVSLPGFPSLPRFLHFPETNVRTYVQDRSGRPGVWFFSLEASTRPAVVTARAGYGVPYFWADMSIERNETQFVYSAKRRWPKPTGATSHVSVEVGGEIPSDELSPLDNFLTARWALFGKLGPFTTYAEMFHEPWPLHNASATTWDDQLVAAAGLRQPTADPVVHFSPRVSVRCGWPAVVR